MSTDSFRANTLVPIILRLVLAAIFLYHGLTKIFGKNEDGTSREWGTAWAKSVWEQPTQMPRELKDRLDRMAKEEEEEREGETEQDKKDRERRRAEIKNLEARLQSNYTRDSKPMPDTMGHFSVQLAVSWGETAGGLLLLLGLLTRWAAVGLLIIQAGAMYTVTWSRGFSFTEGGYEFNLTLLAMCLSLLLLGGGALSMDHWRAQRNRKGK
jgi:uncharacterized membrane protein YphA (DoxX/SURF4 family)